MGSTFNVAYLRMILSDLPSPAEASNDEQRVGWASRRRETGTHLGSRKGKLFAIMQLRAGQRGRRSPKKRHLSLAWDGVKAQNQAARTGFPQGWL